jgi:rubrerythrin
MYKEFAETARAEGFTEIAKKFELVGAIEQKHEERYRKLIENLENSSVFQKEEDVVWICRVCGHLHYGKKAPEKCPTCSHLQAYFEVRCVNY